MLQVFNWLDQNGYIQCGAATGVRSNGISYHWGQERLVALQPEASPHLLKLKWINICLYTQFLHKVIWCRRGQFEMDVGESKIKLIHFILCSRDKLLAIVFFLAVMLPDTL